MLLHLSACVQVFAYVAFFAACLWIKSIANEVVNLLQVIDSEQRTDRQAHTDAQKHTDTQRETHSD